MNINRRDFIKLLGLTAIFPYDVLKSFKAQGYSPYAYFRAKENIFQHDLVAIDKVNGSIVLANNKHGRG